MPSNPPTRSDDPQSKESSSSSNNERRNLADSLNVVRLYQLPDDFFALSPSSQWSAINRVTTRAKPLTGPRKPCSITASDDAIAVAFFLITLGTPLLLAVVTIYVALYYDTTTVGGRQSLLALVVVILLLAFHPLPQNDWRRSRLSLSLIRYFSMEMLIDTTDPLLEGVGTRVVDDDDDPAHHQKRLPLVCLACPHGVFNYGAIIWCCVSRWFVGWEQYTAAANVVKYVPGLRYMDRLIWAVDADRRSIKAVLQGRLSPPSTPSSSSPDANCSNPRRGGMLGIVPDGIAGAFRCRPGTDELVIGTKRGLMRICAEEGATIFAAWFFGTTDMLTVVTDPWGVMEYVSRKLRAGMVVFYGRWYLPVPRRVAVTLACAPYRCKEKVASPTREQVDELHEEVYGRLLRVYDEQKAYAGYPDRKLLIT